MVGGEGQFNSVQHDTIVEYSRALQRLLLSVYRHHLHGDDYTGVPPLKQQLHNSLRELDRQLVGLLSDFRDLRLARSKSPCLACLHE
jgi:hypothetical protein